MLVLLTHRPRSSPITFYYCFLPYKCLWWCSHCESARVSLWHSFSLSTSPIACQERSFRSGVKLPGQILIVQSAVVRWPAENETFANRVPTCVTNLLNLPVLAKLPFYQPWLFGRPARALRPAPPAFRNRRIHLETHWIELRDQPEQSWFWRRCTANVDESLNTARMTNAESRNKVFVSVTNIPTSRQSELYTHVNTRIRGTRR